MPWPAHPRPAAPRPIPRMPKVIGAQTGPDFRAVCAAAPEGVLPKINQGCRNQGRIAIPGAGPEVLHACRQHPGDIRPGAGPTL